MPDRPVYIAAALQTKCDAVNSDPDLTAARNRVLASLDRIQAQVSVLRSWVASFHGLPLRLVVLPEYVLTGFPLQESLAEWRDKAAFAPDSDVHSRLSRIAADNAVFLVANLYERHELDPSLYFQSNLVFSDNGALILRYLRMISINTASPYDLWDRYIDLVGPDGVFPVVATPIGTLGTIASEEILYPEIARAVSLAGAEILAHCTSEVASPALTPKDVAKRARAIENSAYVVSANTAGIHGTSIPQASADGMSKIVAPDGAVVAAAAPGESFNAAAPIDLSNVRGLRGRAAMTNLLARLPAKAFTGVYQGAPTLQPNGLVDTVDRNRGWLRERLADVIQGMRERLPEGKK